MAKKDKDTEAVQENTVDAVEESAVETAEEAPEVDEQSIEAATDEIQGDIAAEVDDTESEDSLTFSNGVIEKIVAIAVREVPGVLGMKGGFVNRIQETFGATVATKGVTVEIAPDNSMRVNIAVIIEYGVYAPQVFEDVKKAVVEQVSGMTGLEVGGVNLRIEDVLTQEEYKRMQHDDEEEAEPESE